MVNADYLTIDAQSALRRYEVFSILQIYIHSSKK